MKSLETQDNQLNKLGTQTCLPPEIPNCRCSTSARLIPTIFLPKKKGGNAYCSSFWRQQASKITRFNSIIYLSPIRRQTHQLQTRICGWCRSWENSTARCRERKWTGTEASEICNSRVKIPKGERSNLEKRMYLEYDDETDVNRPGIEETKGVV